MTEEAIYFNRKEFLKVLGQPEVDTLWFMFRRASGSSEITMTLSEVGDEVAVIQAEQGDADSQPLVNLSRLERKIAALQTEKDLMEVMFRTVVDRLENRINQLEAQL